MSAGVTRARSPAITSARFPLSPCPCTTSEAFATTPRPYAAWAVVEPLGPQPGTRLRSPSCAGQPSATRRRPRRVATQRRRSSAGEGQKNEAAGRKRLMVEVYAVKSADSSPSRPKETAASDSTAACHLPNFPLAEVPDGADESDNVELHHSGRGGTLRHRAQAPLRLGRGARPDGLRDRRGVSGARFVVLKGGWRAWSGRWASSCSTLQTRDHGYTEVSPPLLVRDEAMFGTAQLPKFRDDQFRGELRTPAFRLISGQKKILLLGMSRIHR